MVRSETFAVSLTAGVSIFLCAASWEGVVCVKIFALVVFIAVYAMLLLLPKYRAYVALAAAAIFVALGIVPVGEAVGAVDWNVLLMLAGTMGTVDLFIRSNMPNRLSDYLVRALPNVKVLIIALALFAGLVSAFVDNVATVLMIAPVALEICKKLKTNPVPFIAGIGILRKEGYTVKNSVFSKLVFPLPLRRLSPHMPIYGSFSACNSNWASVVSYLLPNPFSFLTFML